MSHSAKCRFGEVSFRQSGFRRCVADLSSEIRYQERTDQYVLVESEPSSPTSSSTHSDSQVSSVALPATLHEEQAILKDFLASNSNIDSDDDFGDTGVCANCRGN